MYKLTKVEATNPASNQAVVGQEWTGLYEKSTLQVGKRLYFIHGDFYWSTSIIKDISDHPTDKNTKVIKTTYSVYHLTKLK